jgi:hypothetical protein
MSTRRGDNTNLPLKIARELERMGHVKILNMGEVKKTVKYDKVYMQRQSFTKSKLTKVAWVQIYYLDGGAEISGFNAIRVGEELGFEVTGFIVGESSLDLLKSADVIIVNNVHHNNKGPLIDFLLKTSKPWIKYDHDCSESDPELFRKSTMNVFISPMHLEHYVKLCGEEIRAKSIVLPLAFNTKDWGDSRAVRDNNAVLIPNWSKSREAAFKYIQEHPELTFHILDHIKPPFNNAIPLGKKTYDKMAELYPKYGKVFHMPDYKCAGERVLFEAVLSGCEVITNENAGHSSWDFNWRDKVTLISKLDYAIYHFWSKVDEICVNKKRNSFPVRRKTISISTRCMGRKDNLSRSLATWVKMNQFDEIIINDWGMKEDLTDLLIDDRITLIQVPDKDKYDPGIPNNMNARYCKSDYIMMIDADVTMNPDSRPLHKLLDRITTGHYPPKSFIINKRTTTSLNGTCIYDINCFKAVNGFYEGIQHWGYDEVDFHNRLRKAGFVIYDAMFPGMFEHIDHDNLSRFQNYRNAEGVMPLHVANSKNMIFLAHSNAGKQNHTPTKCRIVNIYGSKETEL